MQYGHTRFPAGRMLAGLTAVISAFATLAVGVASYRCDPPAPAPAPGVAVLVFHRVGNGEQAFPIQQLELLIQGLRAEGFYVLSGDEFHRFLEGSFVPSKRGAVLTFDDGYEDLYTAVHPLVVRHRVPALAMCVTKWFTPLPRPEPHFPHLSPSQAREMERSGLWTFGSHSHDGHWLWPEGERQVPAYVATIPSLPRGGQTETDRERAARLWADARLSKATLTELLGREVTDFAFPYGAVDETAKQAVGAAGFRYLYTMEAGLNYPGQSGAIKRVPASRDAAATLQVLLSLFSQRSREE